MKKTMNEAARPLFRLLALLLVMPLVFGPLPAQALAQAAEEAVQEEVTMKTNSGSSPVDTGEEALTKDGDDVAESEDEASSKDKDLLETTPAEEGSPSVAEGQAAESGVGNAFQAPTEDAALTAQSDEDGGPALTAQSASVSNPRMVEDSSMSSGQVVTWDCVWFGSYPQTEVKQDDSSYASLQSASWYNGEATVGGMRYRRISRSDSFASSTWSDDAGTYRYFRYEPIKWRVLKVSGNTALVIADVALDCRPYHKSHAMGNPWEVCTIRSWLNGTGSTPHYSSGAQSGAASQSFVSVAFTTEGQREAILYTSVQNANSTLEGADDNSGNNTQDKLFLLSEAEVHGSSAISYGFVSNPETSDEARRCKLTDYANAMGAYVFSSNSYDGNCDWWLRSPGFKTGSAASVYRGGNVHRIGYYIHSVGVGVRPALNLNLSSSAVSYAGTTSSAPTNLSDVTIAAIPTQAYTGMDVEPKLQVTFDGRTLKEGTNYTLSYQNNVNPGTATVTVTGMGDYTGTRTITFQIKRQGAAVWERLAGPNRYATMGAVVNKAADNSEWAVIATGEDFPDALSAAPIAGSLGCPVVLTEPSRLTAEAETQLRRLCVKNAYIMGSEKSVSAAVEATLRNMGITTTRVYGDNRQETSLMACLLVWWQLGSQSDTLIVAYGMDFPDALSVSPWAWSTGSPILLTGADRRLPDNVLEVVRQYLHGGVKRVVMLGSTNSVSDDVKAQLGNGFQYVRLGGANRYETSALIAEWAAEQGDLNWLHPGITTGRAFADAVSGSALFGSQHSVLLMANSPSDRAVDAVRAHASEVVGGYVLGDENAVSAEVEAALRAATA